jgi:hypothetical protein
MVRCFAIAAAGFVAAASAVAPACDLTKTGAEYCDDFCNNRCGFYNTSAGETGMPQNITIYRITPANVTGVTNKNTADAPGDITFVISKKNVTQQCLHDPHGMGCATDQELNDLYVEAVVEVDGQFGPYQMCNPANGYDTGNWFCGLDCIQPSSTGCNRPYFPPKNGSGFEGVQCYCDRTTHAIGRGTPPNSGGSRMPPAYPPQCAGGYEPVTCIDAKDGSKPYKTLSAWSFASAASMGCQTCEADQACTGWRSLDNRTVELFDTKLTETQDAGCAAAYKEASHHHGGGPSWYGLSNLGGCTADGCTNVWYSTTEAGQCADGAPLGTDGCSWRLVEERKYANATCVDNKADKAVEVHGKPCFDKCPQPLNKNTDCYLNCYRNTLMGDAAQNLTAVEPALIIAPWKNAFATDDPAKGGCPPVKPSVGPLPTPPPTPAPPTPPTPPTPPPTPKVEYYKCVTFLGKKLCLPSGSASTTKDECQQACV